MKVIGIGGEGYPEPESYAYRLCINCGYCVDVCVFDALKHKVRKRSTDSAGAAMKRYEVIRKKREAESNER